MDKFKFSVTSDIFDEFPEAKFGGILVRELTKNPDTIELLKIFQKNVLEDLNSTVVQNDSKIIAWNNFFIKNIGKDKKAAHIALIDRVIKQGLFPQVNELVDIYNTFSVHKRIPIGGHDISNRNEIIVGKTTGGESFQIMNATENEFVDSNEYAYFDDQNRILTRNLVWRQSDYSKITDNTTEFFVPFDDLFNLFTNTQISELMTEFLGILSKFYSYKYEICIIDNYHREHHFNNF
jgi:DNA/RNA-binding domain of Phe-tRNA-synthetase-like protein